MFNDQRNLTGNPPGKPPQGHSRYDSNQTMSSSTDDERNQFLQELSSDSENSLPGKNPFWRNQEHVSNENNRNISKPLINYKQEQCNSSPFTNQLPSSYSPRSPPPKIESAWFPNMTMNLGRYPYSVSGPRVSDLTNPRKAQEQTAAPPQAKPNDHANITAQQKEHLADSTLSTSLSSNEPAQFYDDSDPFCGYPKSDFPLYIPDKENDDDMHDPGIKEKRSFKEDLKHWDKRSWQSLVGLMILFGGFMFLFIVLPILTFSGITEVHKALPTESRYEVLTLYEYPTLGAIRTNLIDPDTPEDALTKNSNTGEEWDLVFSDEFNADGRTFYQGDDQFWTAPDLHYDATKDLEWYEPDAATTEHGVLKLTMDAFPNHNLFYRSGMLQSWNKMCFTQGKLEVSARLPNYGNVSGLWPGIWTLGNLARPGYLATSEGVWPYSYDSCDAGITANQSASDGISYLQGQKLNACTCDGEDHPNPGTGRGAPEIDALEGAMDTVLHVGAASQSFQVAPFDIWYMPDYDFIEVYNQSTTSMNTYCGGPFQQAISGVTTLNPDWYQLGATKTRFFQKYGFEYENGDGNGYCTWFTGDNPTFTLYAQALHPNGNIGWRRISKEPMSIILNLGVSNNWAYIDWASILFPAVMEVDYVRVYQPKGKHSLTCDPRDYPTYDYIEKHKNAYSNFNLTNWKGAGYSFPKQILTGGCSSSKFKAGSGNS